MLMINAIDVQRNRKAWGEHVTQTPIAWVSIDGGPECRVHVTAEVYWAARSQMAGDDCREGDYIGFVPVLQWHMSDPGQPYQFGRVNGEMEGAR